MIAANQVFDHSTIARFRQRHEAALVGLFSNVLSLRADAGLAGVAVIAVDGSTSSGQLSLIIAAARPGPFRR